MSNQDETLISENDDEKRHNEPQKLPDLSIDGHSETIMEPGSEQPIAEAATSDNTLALPEDQTIVEDLSLGNPGTIADQPADESHAADVADEADHTVVEPLSGIIPPPQENADDPAIAIEQPTAEAVEDPGEDNGSNGTQRSMSGSDFDQTSMEDSVDDDGATAIEFSAPDGDATYIEGASPNSDEPDRTIIEGSTAKATDPDVTMVEGATGAESSSATGATEFESSATGRASSKGNWNETRDSNQKKPPTGRKAAHETANRWDAEQRYQLVTNFARGGLGQIWMANDSRLRREVAFKELLPNALKNRNALERFLEEAQITGQLEHPGIVPIYDIGYQENGTPFYAMKLVRGETMEKEIDAFHQLPKGSPEWTLTFRRLLACFIDICNALAFAHDRGVLHRDLKPLNVMIGAFGETLVLDWGLAKVFDVEPLDNEAPITTSTSGLGADDQTIVESEATGLQTGTAVAEPSQGGASRAGASIGGQSQFSGSFGSTRKMVQTDVRSRGSQTMMGSVMGTPAYMPPEQAAGKLDELDARTDIYSLGGILYKLLTNHQPIARGKIREVLKNVKEGNIIPPREHDSSIDKPLEAICMKALATNREDRYDSALKIASDIEAWLPDEPVSVYEEPWPVKAKRWAKRNRATVQSAGIAFAIILLVIAGSAWSHSRELSEIRNVAQTKSQLSAKAADDGDYVQARELLNEALGRTAEHVELVELRSFLSSRLELVETDRRAKLSRDAEAKLARSKSQILEGRYESARALLAELATLLKDESELPELVAEVTRQTRTVTDALAQQEAVADTQARFNKFQAELDQARVRSSFPDEEDVTEDAKLAIEHVRKALAIFDLDKPEPLAVIPQHFSERLPWTREWQQKNGQWPLQTLREGTFELLLTAAEMESSLAQHESDEVKVAAALRSLEWTAKAKSLGISSQALLAREAGYLQQAGRNEDAQRAFAEAKQLQPETSLDFYLLAENLRARGLFNESLEFYLKAQQISPDHYWVQHFLGLCYRNLGQHAAAVSSFSSCIARRPDYPWAYVLRGICSAELGQFENAAADFDQAEKLDPTLFSVFVSRGVVLLTQRKFDDALRNLEKARELKPDSGKPLVNIAAAYWALAEELQKPATDLQTSNDPTVNAASDLEVEQKVQSLYGNALDALTQAENSGAGNHPGLHQLRGQILERRGQTDAALISYRRHLEVDGDAARKAFTLKRIARIHTLLAEHGQAVKDLEASLKLRPSDSNTVLLLAEAQLQLGEGQKAVDRYAEFMTMVNGEYEKTVPSPHLVYNGIATGFHRMQKKLEAVDYYTLSLMFDRRQAVPLTKRAWAFLENGAELAIRDFETARELSPENPDTMIGLAYAYAKKGLWEEAVRELKTSLPLAQAQAKEVGPQAFALFHNSATVYASCVTAVANDERINEEARSTLTTKLSDAAVGQLVEAFTVAKTDSNMLRAMLTAMQNDDALKPIRSSPAYQKFVDQLSAGTKK
ncbi:MAG: protein kinase [Planctomycetota bacterium]|nr:protein kinase [Planctomycetota bacterium]